MRSVPLFRALDAPTTHLGYPAPSFAVIDEPEGAFKNGGVRLLGASPCHTAGWSVANTLPRSINFRRQPMDYNKEFDASGLACPLPIVKTKKALADMVTGQVLRVISTDPGSVCDMAAFAEQTGNALLEQGSENSKFVFYLKKA